MCRKALCRLLMYIPVASVSVKSNVSCTADLINPSCTEGHLDLLEMGLCIITNSRCLCGSCLVCSSSKHGTMHIGWLHSQHLEDYVVVFLPRPHPLLPPVQSC